jgi:quercetin dioxygenase-like cupin family protein
MQEVFVLLSGQVTMQVGNAAVTMNPGDTVIIEPTEIHQMTNTSDELAEYLVFGIASGKGGKTVVV